MRIETVALHQERNVTLTAYLQETAGEFGFERRPAMLVLPGGGYAMCSDREADPVAAAYLKAGYQAFILRYACTPRGKWPLPLEDYAQAMALIEERADEWHLDNTKIAVVGFSAGGHLVMSGAELFAPDERPAFVAPIYPVVTMTEDCVHKRSRRALLGDSRMGDQALRDSLSLERHVPANCPPVFLVNCQDDPIVDYRNSVLLDSALTAQGVPHLYLQYRTGGHGFGASDSKGTAECRQWRARFVQWLSTL